MYIHVAHLCAHLQKEVILVHETFSYVSSVYGVAVSTYGKLVSIHRGTTCPRHTPTAANNLDNSPTLNHDLFPSPQQRKRMLHAVRIIIPHYHDVLSLRHQA